MKFYFKHQIFVLFYSLLIYFFLACYFWFFYLLNFMPHQFQSHFIVCYLYCYRYQFHFPILNFLHYLNYLVDFIKDILILDS